MDWSPTIVPSHVIIFAFSLEIYIIWLHLFPMGINKATQMI
jgi:hypothetical protein